MNQKTFTYLAFLTDFDKLNLLLKKIIHLLSFLQELFMCNLPNYTLQTQNIPVQNNLQTFFFLSMDTVIYAKEVSKMGVIVGLVISSSNLIFNFDSSFAFTWTTIFGISWILTTACTKKFENQANTMINHLKRVEEQKIYFLEEEIQQYLG